MKHSLRSGLGALLFLAACVITVSPAYAQENEDCMRCHEDDELYVEKGDQELPGWIVMDAYERSSHGRLECIACHLDLMDAELPHEDDLEPVDCAECHEELAERHANTDHGKAIERGDDDAPHCYQCHGKHDIVPASDKASRTHVMNIPLLCGTCHHEGTEVSLEHELSQDKILENYSQSIHGEGLFKKGLAVTAVCTSCHTSHDILKHSDPRSSVHPSNIAETCTSSCHSRIEEVHRKVIEGRLWEEEPHKIPNCVDCHSPHKIRTPFYEEGLWNKDCLICHADPKLTMERDGEAVSLYIDPLRHDQSVHGETGCAQCHTEATKAIERACVTIRNKVDCSVCHAEVVTDHQAGEHGRLVAAGDTDAPDCGHCHVKHFTKAKTDPASPTYPLNIPKLCAECHESGHVVTDRRPDSGPNPVKSYAMSIHGKTMSESGLVVTATCASCHGAHKVLPADDPESSVHHVNVPITCGNCHQGIRDALKKSVHWPGNEKTDQRLPGCADCHTAHQIQRADRMGFGDAMSTQCGDCHEEQASTFLETFHGKVSRLGFDKAAKCGDCHGSHDIVASTVPGSALSPEKRNETCGQCHKGAHESFTQYLTHASHTDKENHPELYWAFVGMTTLLVGTLIFFGLHSLLWMRRLWMTRSSWAAIKARRRQTELYRRFSRIQRAMHTTMVICFMTLALTGMALKFSHRPWAQNVAEFLGGFRFTGGLHRLAAVGLIIVFLLHLWDVNRMRRREGRSWLSMVTGPDTIIFTLTDLKEFWGTVKWFFGKGERPRYGRWSYWEKFDYFAVLWGVGIIGSTGMLLWKPVFLTQFVPGWFVNVATIIHSDEALLATGFIFTIHFFNTQFRPDKFPLDPVIFNGRMSIEELQHEKPREYEDLVAKGLLEEKTVKPLPPAAERAIRAFAFAALAFGVILIVTIFSSLLLS